MFMRQDVALHDFNNPISVDLCVAETDLVSAEGKYTLKVGTVIPARRAHWSKRQGIHPKGAKIVLRIAPERLNRNAMQYHFRRCHEWKRCFIV